MGPKKSYNVQFKLEVLKYAQENSGEAAARKYGIHPRSIRSWKKQKDQLLAIEGKHLKRKKLEGGGRKKISAELEDNLYQWILEKRSKRLRVTRNMIKTKATEIFRTVEDNTRKDFTASNGWLENFMKRFGLSLRRKTTQCQKDPDQLVDKLVSFVIHVSNKVSENKINETNIIAADETAVWFDMVGTTTVDVAGAKSVSLKSTGHDKANITLMLAARGDGTKLKPYIIFKGAVRDVKKMQSIPGVIVASSINGWFNDELTVDWLKRVVGKFNFASRLLVWDSYRCHTSKIIKDELKQGYNIEIAVIPGGCTKYIQAPDVSWNKPMKDRLRKLYDDWMASDNNKEYTAAGNMKPPSRELLVSWIKKAWGELDINIIKKSFKSCALTISNDGSQDDLIHCFKAGQPCQLGRQRLNEARQGMGNDVPGLPAIEANRSSDTDDIYDDTTSDTDIYNDTTYESSSGTDS